MNGDGLRRRNGLFNNWLDRSGWDRRGIVGSQPLYHQDDKRRRYQRDYGKSLVKHASAS